MATGPGLDEETSSKSNEKASKTDEMISKPDVESPRTRLCVEGQVVTGRLNIHRPADGPAKYYINWGNRTHDNLTMDPEEMKKDFRRSEKAQSWYVLQGNRVRGS